MTARDPESERMDQEIARERHEEWWAEPPELTEWADKRAAVKAAEEAHAAVLCAACGLPRGHADHSFGSDRTGVRCRFVETCPNLDDPILCSVHEGVFIPEAGCPVHDREPS